MPLATYRGLCLDATDAAVLGAFWAGALGLDLQLHDDGDAHLTGPTPAHTVWVNRVPEPKTAKHRMHLDVNAGSVAELERLGATVLDAESFRWTLMADPEGGELCAFVREGEVSQRLCEVVVDCGDSPGQAHRIASWWAQVLGARAADDERGFSWVEAIPDAPFDALVFVPVPEPKTAKNRVHLDVTTPDLGALVGFGAVAPAGGSDDRPWTVLADPDGNELCAFPAG